MTRPIPTKEEPYGPRSTDPPVIINQFKPPAWVPPWLLSDGRHIRTLRNLWEFEVRDCYQSRDIPLPDDLKTGFLLHPELERLRIKNGYYINPCNVVYAENSNHTMHLVKKYNMSWNVNIIRAHAQSLFFGRNVPVKQYTEKQRSKWRGRLERRKLRKLGLLPPYEGNNKKLPPEERLERDLEGATARMLKDLVEDMEERYTSVDEILGLDGIGRYQDETE